MMAGGHNIIERNINGTLDPFYTYAIIALCHSAAEDSIDLIVVNRDTE